MNKFCYFGVGLWCLYAITDARVYTARKNRELLHPSKSNRSLYVQSHIDEFNEWRNMPILLKITHYPDLPHF